MSQISRSAALPADDLAPDMDGEGAFSPWEAIDWLWRVFTSMRLALALMLGLAVLGVIGSLIVQAPPGLTSDAQAYGAWLQGLRPKYGGFVGIFDRLGFFAIFQSIWFRVIVVALTTSILACSVKRFPGLWKAAVHPRTHMHDTFFASAPLHASFDTESGPDAALDVTRRVFRAHHYRTLVEPDGEVSHLYVDRFRWSPFGTVIAHVSVVLILGGAMIGSAFGYRDNNLAVAVGSTVEVGGGSNLALLARSFSDSYYESGAPSDYSSSLVLYRDGTEVAAKTIRVNDPLTYDGFTFYQSFFGPAAVMEVADGAGQVLYQGGVPLLWSSDDSTRRIGQFAPADTGVTVYVVGAASGRIDPNIKAGQMQLEIYRDGADEPFAIEILSQGEPATIGDLQYTFQREQQFTGLMVARDPGEILVWLGALALVGGLFLIFMFPHRRIWIAIRRRSGGGGEVALGATAHHDATFGPEFNRLVEQVRLAVQQAG